MPHKKAKADKSKKASKPAKSVVKAHKGGAGDAAKKAAKKPHHPVMAKKAGKPALPQKKGAPHHKGKAEAHAAKDKKHSKQAHPAHHAPSKGDKGDKGAKKKAEVVVEVPAPKGVAILNHKTEPKKKAKGADAVSASARRRCREPGCDHDAVLHGYCRLHYIKNWRKIKRKEAILASGQLNNYVEELVNKYPDKYLDVIRQDLASEKEWAKVVVDLELEASDEDAGGDEDLDAVAEGVRPAAGGRGEFEGDDDSF